MKSTIVPIRIPNDKIEKLKQEADKEFLPLATFIRRTVLNTISEKEPATA